MKRLLSVLGICVIAGCFSTVNSAELTVAAPASGSAGTMDEINSSFSQSKDTNWLIHRIKPTDKNITKTKSKPKVKIPEFDESEYIFIHKTNNSDNSTEQVNKKNDNTTEQEKKQYKKETVNTVKPAEKIIKEETKTKAKEDSVKQRQEDEKKLYRELQDLSNLYQQAVALYNDNNLDDSLEAFAKIPEDKRPPEAYLLMGNILLDKGKKDEAVFMYGRAILTDSTYYKAYYNLGNVYLNDDKFNMAIEQYKMAGKYNPNNPYVFYNMGCAYIKAGDLKKAKNSFIRALEINNRIADFHYNLAYVYKKLGKEKLSKTYLNNYNKLTGQVD